MIKLKTALNLCKQFAIGFFKIMGVIMLAIWPELRAENHKLERNNNKVR